MDSRIYLAKQVATYGLLVSAGFAIYVIVKEIVFPFGYAVPTDDLIFTLIFILAYALVFVPAREALHNALDWLIRSPHVPGQIELTPLVRQLYRNLNLEQARALISEQLAALEPAWAGLWLYEEPLELYRPYNLGDYVLPVKREWLAGSAWTHYLAMQPAAFVLSRQTLSESEITMSEGSALAGSVCGPLWLGDMLVGWLLLGPRADNGAYTDAHRVFLTALAEQCAPALYHAQQLDTLRYRFGRVRQQATWLNSVLAGLPGDIIAVDSNGTVTLVTPAIVQELVEPGTNPVGKPYADALPALRPYFDKALPEVLSQPGTVTLKAHFLHGGRGMKHLRLHFASLLDKDKRVSGGVIFVQRGQ